MRRAQDEYVLMHKDIPVCLIAVDEDGNLRNIRRIEKNADHFPIGGQMNDMKFHDWWRDRAIPKTRHGAKTALQKLGYATTGIALVDNLALSLSDCYWICPRGEGIRWKDVSLFSNDFVDSFGEITIDPDYPVDLRRKTRFNCASTQGELQKKWCIDASGRRYLVKGNYGSSYQQSLNEIFATDLHEKQGFPSYTRYSLAKIQVAGGQEGLGCLCYDYCSDEIESISAWELLQTVKLRRNESLYHPLHEVCLRLGMQEEAFSSFMDYEIMTDYLLSNTDRHMNNIAVMRNPDTLKLLGFAPIYDSGNSMFYNVPYEQLAALHLDQIRTHSFVEKEPRLLQYVHDRSLVDVSRAEMDFTIFEQDVTERQIRIPYLQELYHRKMDSLLVFQHGSDLWKRL